MSLNMDKFTTNDLADADRRCAKNCWRKTLLIARIMIIVKNAAEIKWQEKNNDVRNRNKQPHSISLQKFKLPQQELNGWK